MFHLENYIDKSKGIFLLILAFKYKSEVKNKVFAKYSVI